MITGIEELDCKLVKLFENIHTCSLVCKKWNKCMIIRKLRIKTALGKGIEMYIGNFNKRYMINYKTKKPSKLDKQWIVDYIPDIVKYSKKPVFITRKCTYFDCCLTSISDIEAHLDVKHCCSWSYKRIKKLCAVSKKQLCDLVYATIQFDTILQIQVYILVFENRLDIYRNHKRTCIIWKGNNISFIDYKNNVLCYEFAGGLYVMEGFEEPVFMCWISEF